MMIDSFIKSVTESLPLRISFISWDGDVLVFSGENWSFSTLSAWRVIHDGTIEFACFDNDIEKQVDAISGLSIVGIQP